MISASVFITPIMTAVKQVTRLRAARGLLCAVAALSMLASCGGGDPGDPDGGAPSTLFISDAGRAAVSSLVNANPAPGILSEDRLINGPGTSISGTLPDLAYDAGNDRLYVANSTSILVFNNASRATGNAVPARTISSAQMGTIRAVSLDTANNRLYVANQSSSVLVFNSAASINGSVSPDRTIAVTWNANPLTLDDVVIDATRNMLYVSGNVGGALGVDGVVLVYDSAGILNGNVGASSRALIFGVTVTLNGIDVDRTGNRLFAANVVNDTIMVFDTASTATGPIGPTRTINMPATVRRPTLSPASDRLYALPVTGTGFYIVNGAALANGFPPSSLITRRDSLSIFSAIAVVP